MKKRLLFIASTLLLGGCMQAQEDITNISIMHDFEIPTALPFEVDQKQTIIDIQHVDGIHQYITSYDNDETGQFLKYILSQHQTNETFVHDTLPHNDRYDEIFQLDNGTILYYLEGTQTQSIWWAEKDDYVARFTYMLRDTDGLGDYKLEVDELIDLVIQVHHS